MNTLNPLETSLRSWTPRPPSPRLERRFYLLAAVAASRQSATFLGREQEVGGALLRRRYGVPTLLSQAWLSPIAACLVLGGLVIALRGNPPPLADRSHGALVAMIFSNQSYAAYLPGSFQRNQNRWDTFEWTNTGHFTSSEGPISRSKQITRTPHGQD